MTLHTHMSSDLFDMADELENMLADLNSARTPCCQLDRFRLWDDEDEARVHRQIHAVQKKIRKIAGEVTNLREERGAIDK